MNNKHISIELRQAKAEIKAIMDKYDLGGLVSLHNKTHTEFEFFLPKWSVIQFEDVDGKRGVRIKHKKDECKKPEVLGSYHVLMDCQQVCAHIFQSIDWIREQVKDKIEIDTTHFKDR